MKIDVLIDKLTPCLERVSTGEILATVFSIARNEELRGLQKRGWNFNWIADELKDTIVYKLTLKDDDVIQGLIAVEINPKEYAIHAHLVESAPHNLGKSKEYEGVGGHLFAIAIKLSLALGFDGFVYMDAKNPELVRHYAKTLGAIQIRTRIHEYRMAILEDNAQRIIEKYTLEGDLNVER